jgi:hypothetical protein
MNSESLNHLKKGKFEGKCLDFKAFRASTFPGAALRGQPGGCRPQTPAVCGESPQSGGFWLEKSPRKQALGGQWQSH